MNKVKSAIGSKLWKARRQIRYPLQNRGILAACTNDDTPEPYRGMGPVLDAKETWWRG